MKRLRKFLYLTSSDRQLLLRSLVLLITIKLGLWLLPFQTWRQIVARMTQKSVQLQIDRVSVDKVVWAVEVASRYMPGGVKCLARGLATQVLLKRRGYQAQLRIGVVKNEKGQLEAHAWVESQGRIVIGGLKDLARYTPLPSLEVERA